MINYPRVLYNKWGDNSLVRFVDGIVSFHWRNKIFKGSQVEPVIYVDHSIELGQSTHPDLIYDENNNLFFMTVSNYPYGIERLEDSYVLVSNDGIRFRNTKNGAIEKYGGSGRSHFSDGDMVYDGELYSLFYRYCERDQIDAKDIISISTSADGLSWSDGKEIIVAPKDQLVSPAFIYDNGQYKMYYVVLTETGSVLYRCNSVSKEFQNYQSDSEMLTVKNVPEGMMLWHINVSIDGDFLHGLFTFSTGFGGANARLYYATSIKDSNVWIVKGKIDPKMDMKYIKKIYRSALVKVMDCWYLYLAICLKNDCWFIGRREFSEMESLIE